MRRRRVVRVKDGEARIVSTKRWLEYQRRRAAPPAGEALAAGGDACEEACENHGGVEDCGETFASCNDGTAWLLDP